MGTHTRSICLLVIVFALAIPAALLADAGSSAKAPECPAVWACSPVSVFYYDDTRPEAWISIGSDAGLRPHARVAFLHGGKEVAQGDVVAVHNVDAVVRPDKGTAGGAIMRGDDIKILENGSEAQTIKEARRDQRTGTLRDILMTGLLTYLILL
jgi:hypothetical protein